MAAAHYKEILPEEESRACMASEALAWAQDTPYHAEEILRFADGQPHTLEVIKTKIKDSSGTAIGLIGLGVDVTEHKQAQRELQQSETRFRELAQREALLNRMVNQIRNSLDIDTIIETALHEVRNLLCTDSTGLMGWRADACGWELVRRANANSAPCELGLYTAENVGSSVESLRRGETLRIDEVDTLDDPILKQYMLEMGYTSLLNVPFQTQSGEIGALIIIKCSNDSHPWTDSEVELIQAVADQLAIAIDQAELYKQSRLATAIAQAQTQQLDQTLRELKNTQAQLIQNEKMSSLGQMVAGVAHEINNPVSFIYGNVDFASHYFQDLLSLIELYQQSLFSQGIASIGAPIVTASYSLVSLCSNLFIRLWS